MKLKQRFTGFGKILKATYKGWNADDPFRQSAVIAYYAIFSLPALLVLIVNVVGFFFEKDIVNGEISRQIEGVMGSDTATQVNDIVEKASEMKAGVISTIIAVVTLIFGATGVFVELQKSLNQVWDVKQREDLGFIKKLRGRLFSFGLILSIGFLLLISLVLSSVLAAASNWLESILPEAVAYLFYVLEFVVSLSVITVLFALMFKYLPDVKMRWKNVWIGAALTGGLFILGKYGLSFYFGKAQPASVYGAAGSIVLMLLWVSYSSMIVFFGAEFTKQYAVFHDVKITPTRDAVKVNVNLDEHQKTKGKEEKSDKALSSEKSNLNDGYIYNREYQLKENHKPHQRNVHEKVSELDLKVMEKIEEIKKPALLKMKNQKELQHEIARLERRLAIDGQDIKDDFKWTSLFGGLIPRALKLRLSKEKHKKMGFDDVLRGVARNHIGRVQKEETIIDKIKKLLHADD
ncbi:MAG: YihY/virulence factor BrkB family protein [Bacteroidetes bacterium]|nr:YihY/virulence factor BrkB family protein [Bacteroidota bacterium]